MDHRERHQRIEALDREIHKLARENGVTEPTHTHKHAGESLLHCTTTQINALATAIIDRLGEDAPTVVARVKSIVAEYTKIEEEEHAEHQKLEAAGNGDW